MELTFSFIDIKKDKPLIASWERKYFGTEGLKAIRHYVLEDNLYYSLKELIEINYEHYPIGHDEFKKTLVAKTEDGEVAGFIIYDVFNLSHNPEANLIYIAINPAMQNRGVGTAMMTELFENPKKYFKCKPTAFITKIDRTNIASQKLCQKFGFHLIKKPRDIKALCVFEASYENVLQSMEQQEK